MTCNCNKLQMIWSAVTFTIIMCLINKNWENPEFTRRCPSLSHCDLPLWMLHPHELPTQGCHSQTRIKQPSTRDGIQYTTHQV